MHRLTLPLAAGVAAVVVAGTAVAGAATVGPQAETDVTATVTVSGMLFVPDALAGDVALPQSPMQTFTVTAPSAQFDAVVEQRVQEASAQLKKSTKLRRGVASPEATNTVFGNCGSSYIILQSTSSQTQGQGYMKAGFDLSGVTSAGAYDTDVLLFSSAASDLWTDHVPEAGDLGGGTRWSNDTRFDVPKTQGYGATLQRANVSVTWANGAPGTCWSNGPRVNNVRLYKS